MTRPLQTDDTGARMVREASARAEVVLPADAHVLGEPVAVTRIVLGERNLSSSATLALYHSELGVAVGSPPMGKDFDAVLPRGLVENNARKAGKRNP